MTTARLGIMSMAQSGMELLEEILGKQFTLFEAFGIDFNLHISVIAIPIYAFFFVGLDWSGILFALAVIASILLHEVGHAIIGGLVGHQVREICLFACGGYTRFSCPLGVEARDALVALAGPMANGLICCLLIWIEAAIDGGNFGNGMKQVFNLAFDRDFSGEELTWRQIFIYTFALINFSMFLLNLLPAFPLDGGRIFNWIASCFLSAGNAAFMTMVLSRTIACLIVIQCVRKNLLGDFNLFNLIYMPLIAIVIWCASKEEYLCIIRG